jgi:hypothetical protein
MLPVDMEDAGGGKYTYTIYPPGEGPEPGDPEYSTEDVEAVLVKIMVTTENGKSYWPDDSVAEADENGYYPVPLDYDTGGGDGDGSTDGGDGDGDDDDDDGSIPGFEAALFLSAFAAITLVALMRRRLFR